MAERCSFGAKAVSSYTSNSSSMDTLGGAPAGRVCDKMRSMNTLGLSTACVRQRGQQRSRVRCSLGAKAVNRSRPNVISLRTNPSSAKLCVVSDKPLQYARGAASAHHLGVYYAWLLRATF